ncbi:hypothetical protein MPDQ_003365 [Monascus purpureus]|uniref:TATA element modulatory factor 1 TATA binding domain-containing protein n=1 Tax=Monascus purpureus TaxID=5098 RepID=A0A507QL32_MONPU|nr:hypothetical protein MPDQ_003365 [Monascus purpureus]BDD54742.1 hypothetical protein MAP00_000334 [Monascus purpureus]
MTQNSQATRPKWAVGSFFQQAVAGVESRLDLILADPDEAPSKNAATKAKQDERQTTESLSRSSSSARKNDRLQERLARAIVRSNTPAHLAAQSSASRVSSRTASPVPSVEARSSVEVETSSEPLENMKNSVRNSAGHGDALSTTPVAPRISHDSVISSRNSKETPRSETEDTTPKEVVKTEGKVIAQGTETPEEPTGVGPKVSDAPGEAPQIITDQTSDTLEPVEVDKDKAEIAQLKAEHEAAELRWQEEIHGYIERIDALQSKLKYLAREAAESAKDAAATAGPKSVEKQLREKDEKIALLLEEGQNLSKSELDHRTVIKKLRQQLIEQAKAQEETKKKIEKLEGDLANSEARARRAETSEKKANDSLASKTKAARDLESVTAERDVLSQTVQEMRAQLSRAVARAESAEAKAHSEALEQEKRRVAELEKELTNFKIERDIAEEKFKRQINGLRENVEQEKERTRILEVELKGEQSVLESKMESLRSRAEEASSGTTGDTQAKLLRQIETLQTQYVVASENWQTLEGSLLARLASVERERDDLTRQEADMRRKIREANLKAKKAVEELENAQETQQDLANRVEEGKQELLKMEQRLKKATDELSQLQKDLVDQKKVCDTWAQRLEDERAKWNEQMNLLPSPNSLHRQRRESAIAYNRRPSANLDATAPLSDYRSTSRRSSMLPLVPGLDSIGSPPPRQNSYPTSSASQSALPIPPQILTNTSNNMLSSPTVVETPSVTFEPDEFFSVTPSAYGAAQTHHSRGINDIISESTAGAGPSVQLVERMSAAVRRLESERAAFKDELARVAGQRDEARQQVVDLMREVEEKRNSDIRVQELEKHISELDQRYQTTLEMLGEKSEQVEELRADIADLKKIYRELVDSTMK